VALKIEFQHLRLRIDVFDQSLLAVHTNRCSKVRADYPSVWCNMPATNPQNEAHFINSWHQASG